MKKILITGASGFIGRHLTESLSADYTLLHPGHMELNLLDWQAVETYLTQNRCDIIIHTANCNNIRHCNMTEYDILSQNLTMFLNLERCGHLYERMYYFGSGAEYDASCYVPKMQEKYLGHSIPKDAYGLSKYIMAKISLQDNNIYDLVLFGVYGKYEEWQRRFISNNICRNLHGMPMSIRQNRYFDYLYIDDLINIMRWFLEHTPKQKRCNVCTGRSIDLHSLAVMINQAQTTDTKILVRQPGFGPEYSGCNQLLLQEMGDYRFLEPPAVLPELIAYYRSILPDIPKSALIDI